jgi:tetratricopeptide (TPR) repeat protein
MRLSGKWSAATDAFRTAIDLDSDNAGYHLNLGDALKAQGNLEEAVESYRKAIDLQPLSIGNIILGMTLRYDLGREREAIDVYRSGIDAGAVQPGPLHEQLARALANPKDQSLRDPTQAVMHAQKALEFPPGSGGESYIWVTLGMAHYRAGQWSDAVKALEQAAAAGPQTEANGDFFLAMAYWQLGQTQKAHEAYDRAIEWTESHSQQSTYATLRNEVESVLGLADRADAPAESSADTQ